MAWVHSGTNVFGPGTVPSTWTSLDLSSVVGSNQRLVFLRFLGTSGSSSSSRILLRPTGDTDDWYIGASGDAMGGYTSAPVPVGEVRGVFVETDSSGTVEWRCFSVFTANVEVEVIGYFDSSTHSGTQVFTGATPTSWTDLDLSGVIGSSSALVILKAMYDSGTAREMQFRFNGDTEDCVDGVSNVNQANAGEATGPVVVADSDAIIEWQASGSGHNSTIDILGYVNTGWTSGITEVYSSAAPPTSWTDLDLSSVVGSTQMIVALALRATINVGGTTRLAVRPNGDVGDWLHASNPYRGTSCLTFTSSVQSGIVITETDSNGVIEWIADNGTALDIQVDVLGHGVNNQAPVLAGGNPTGSTESPGAEVSCTFTDDSGISAATLDVDLTDPDSTVHNAIVNGAFQTGYSGSAPSNGATAGTIAISGHPDLAAGQWTVDVSLTDQGGLSDTLQWNFTVVDTYYRNRCIAENGSRVRWVTVTPDSTGTYFPGPGAFENVSDYCVEKVKGIVKQWRNRVNDPLDGVVRWVTSTPDTTGASYPGTSAWEEVSNYSVEFVENYNDIEY